MDLQVKYHHYTMCTLQDMDQSVTDVPKDGHKSELEFSV